MSSRIRLFQISRKQGMEIMAEGIINAVARSQRPATPKATANVLLATSIKSKLNGANPATSVASPAVSFQDFQFTSMTTAKPKARPAILHGKRSAIRIGTDIIEIP